MVLPEPPARLSTRRVAVGPPNFFAAIEPGVLPREQQLDALLAQQLLVSQKGNHFVAEEELRRGGIDVRHRDPDASAIPAATRYQRVNVRAPLEEVRRGLHHADHPGPNASIVGVPAAISSCTVSQAACDSFPSSSR
jgi:hypothetical protein